MITVFTLKLDIKLNISLIGTYFIMDIQIKRMHAAEVCYYNDNYHIIIDIRIVNAMRLAIIILIKIKCCNESRFIMARYTQIRTQFGPFNVSIVCVCVCGFVVKLPITSKVADNDYN